MLYVGADAGTHLVNAREALSELDVNAGATSFDGVLIARLVAEDATTLRAGVSHVVSR